MTELLPSLPLAAQVQLDITEPKLLSAFPAGGLPGQTVEIEVRGVLLEGASSAWSEEKGLAGRVQSIEELPDRFPEQSPGDPKPKAKSHPVYRVRIEVAIPADSHPGTYPLRLVTARGLSNSVPFRILTNPLVTEASVVHSNAKEAQEVHPPAFIFARIAQAGEIDLYRFPGNRGQIFNFEISNAQNFDARLEVYRRGGSWFDADRPSRVLLEEERTSDLMPIAPRGTFRVPEDGDYFLEVSSLFGKGSADSTYQLRITPGSFPAGPNSGTEFLASGWTERSFRRNLRDSWIEGLASRSVIGASTAPGLKSTATAQATGAAEVIPSKVEAVPPLLTHPEIVRETEPDDAAAQTPSITLPAILEGAIDRPDDVDSFRFRVVQGQKITFEIETPATAPPHFNPRIGVEDTEDHEFFSNVDRRLSMFNNNADPHVFLKAISSRSTYTFERGGEYTLQVRDITSRYGNPDFRYRILIRQQIPHVGEISMGDADAINLRPGEPRRISLTAQFEEGFTGDVSFTVEGLPPGVQALPAAQYSDGRAPLEVAQNPEIVLPKEQKAAIVLVASPDAPLSREPVLASLRCQPIADGRMGSSFLVRSIPIMVLASRPEAKVETGK